MHTHPVAGKRRRLSFVIMVAGYAAAWMVAVPVLANLAQTGFIARHHLEALPNHHLPYPPYARDLKTVAAMPAAGRPETAAAVRRACRLQGAL